MRRRFWILLVLAVLSPAADASAGGRRQRMVERGGDAQVPTPGPRGRDFGVPSRAPTARTNPGRYPKYSGGFHSRELQNSGVPTGDQGLRGNGFSMYPW